jgi:hypothetical protein
MNFRDKDLDMGKRCAQSFQLILGQDSRPKESRLLQVPGHRDAPG